MDHWGFFLRWQLVEVVCVFSTFRFYLTFLQFYLFIIISYFLLFMCVYITQKIVGTTLGKTVPYSLAFGFCLPSWGAGRVPEAWAVLTEEKMDLLSWVLEAGDLVFKVCNLFWFKNKIKWENLKDQHRDTRFLYLDKFQNCFTVRVNKCELLQVSDLWLCISVACSGVRSLI